jgi:hypothetical protein
MDDLDNSSKIQDPEDDPLLLDDFMSALQRLLRIGVYYPAGHAILDKATDRFLSLLQSLARSEHFVRIEDDGRSLLLEQVRLAESQPFVDELRQLMANLSITSIEISRDISKEDLHEFIRRIVAGRSQGTGIMHFSQVEITDLPATIHVTQKEFLAREDISTDGRLDSASRNLNAFFEALTGYGLTAEQIDQCRLLLTSLPARMKKLAFKPGELPSVGWDDIAQLLAHTVQGKPLVQRSSSHGNLDMLSSILSSLEEETEDKKSREAINLLVSIIKKPILEQDKEKKEEGLRGVSAEHEVSPLSTAQLQDFVDKNRLNPSSLQKVQDIPKENETLAVLLQLAQQRQSLSNQARILQFLNDIFAVPLQDKTWDILTLGLLAIIRTNDPNSLSSTVRMITESLRRSHHADPLEFFLKTFMLCREDEVGILWPFAVNELLVSGNSAHDKTSGLLCTRLARLPWKEMIQALPILQSLEAFQRGQVAAGVFSELSPSCYPLCAFLLKTPIAAHIQGNVIAGLRNSTGDDLIKAVAPLLDASLPEHKNFLDKYLLHSTRRGAGDGLKVLAGDLIVRGLSVMPQDLREQPWVARTIGAMADFQGSGGRELLNQIVTAKRMLLLPEWPAACRKAAGEVLVKMRRRPKSARKQS